MFSRDTYKLIQLFFPLKEHCFCLTDLFMILSFYFNFFIYFFPFIFWSSRWNRSTGNKTMFLSSSSSCQVQVQDHDYILFKYENRNVKNVEYTTGKNVNLYVKFLPFLLFVRFTFTFYVFYPHSHHHKQRGYERTNAVEQGCTEPYRAAITDIARIFLVHILYTGSLYLICIRVRRLIVRKV